MKEFKIFVFQNKIIQFSKNDNTKNKDYWSNDFYNIYLNGKCYTRSAFRFYFELEFEKILNAKSIIFDKINLEYFL